MEKTIKKPSIKKNYFYNLAFQIFLLITPLITTPYVSRILLPEGIGKYSFSFSIIQYYVIFASLGFGYYAQREIAKHQDDLYKQSKSFWEIIICRLIPVSISLAINLSLCVFNVYSEYTFLMYILSINIINVAIDVTFFFQGNEKFKSIVYRNFIIKVLSILAIFLFVKKQDDLWIYVLVSSLSTVLSSISMLFPLRKMLVRIPFNDLQPLKHLKGTLLLFLPTVAITIYTILDKTLIGLLIKDTYTFIDENGVEIIKKYSDLENGYYEQSERIVKMFMTIVTSVGIVMIPRNSNEISQGNFKVVIDNIYKTSNFVLLIGLPMMFGLIITSDLFVPWFFGDGYDKCKILLKVLSPLIVIIGLSNVFAIQYLVPLGKDKKFTLAVVIGSVINFVLNIFFIKLWWSIGASIATIVAETIITIVLSIIIRKEINVVKIILYGWKYFVSGIIMFVSLFFITKLFSPTIVYTFLTAIIGVVIYFSLLFILRDRTTLNFMNKLINRIKHK